MSAKKAKPGPLKAGARPPNDDEQAMIRGAAARHLARPKRVAVAAAAKVKGDTKTIAVDTPHSDRAGWHIAVQDAIGSRSIGFVERTISDVANVLDPHAASGTVGYDAALAMFGAIAPRDELEGALAAQIVATHGLSMDCMGRAARADRLDQRETYINQATKLGRTMTAQIEALNRLRTGGKQRVEVVYVDARGGQNVIGVRTDGGAGVGGEPLNGTQPHVASLPFAPGSPMRGEDASGYVLPAAGDAREAALSPAWREESGRPKGGEER